MKKVGILGLQGGVIEHYNLLKRIEGIKPLIVKTKKEISSVNALILPGGESTAIGKLLDDFDLTNIIRLTIQNGIPVWGTCAGMILLAKKISNYDKTFLKVMDIEVKRNAYGSQLDSFKTKISVPEVSNTKIPAVFIRAPYAERVWGDVDVLAKIDNKIIACREYNMLATSFHPELTDDISFHKYFVEKMVNA